MLTLTFQVDTIATVIHVQRLFSLFSEFKKKEAWSMHLNDLFTTTCSHGRRGVNHSLPTLISRLFSVIDHTDVIVN